MNKIHELKTLFESRELEFFTSYRQMINYIIDNFTTANMSPGIGLMKRRLEKEKDAVSLAVSGIAKQYNVKPNEISTLETKYHQDAGDWYVALGWEEQEEEQKKAIVKMDSVQGIITEIKEI